ncbi:thiocillin family RiPP [Massilia sp. W12]|uniref:thiocillin family RiPP n=1 Tax=Massilia sp. W12 TaxID=3126507 RepID=UPI0030CB8181
MFRSNSISHAFDLATASSDIEVMAQSQFFVLEPEDKAIDTFGCLGSAGTFGGCFGCLGTAGCCC